MDLSQAGQSGDIALEKQRALLEAAQHISGVTAAGIINSMPIGGGAKGIPVFPPGTTEFTLDKSVLETRLYAISPGYMQAAGTRQMSGRDISWNDTAQTPKVAIINKNFARKMWGNASAIGQHFYLKGTLTEVVGVVETGIYHDLAEAPLAATFVPITQYEDSAAVLVVKSQLASSELSPALRHTLGSVEPNVPLTIESWPDALDDLLFPARAATLSLGIMGVLAAMLAVTGVFGMAAYSVSRRIKELGIRMALGADKIQVTRAAIGRPILLLAAGSTLGLGAGFLASSLMKKMVYQANPGDPTVIAGVVLTMTLLGIAASAIPVRRALSINPSQLIREE
jgi:ABC-type antimicrobial peptide transport system permease subunit